MKENPLGKKINPDFNYNPNLLFSIPRDEPRRDHALEVLWEEGYDLWQCYELTWLSMRGKPEVRFMTLKYPASTPRIIESKSLKLYLTAFCMNKYQDEDEIRGIIIKDLVACLESSDVEITFYGINDREFLTEPGKDARNIDNCELATNIFKRDPLLLNLEKKVGEGIVSRMTHLFQSNCPITGQPDWATVIIDMDGDTIPDDKSLLEYLISFREEKEYHETCCEEIFSDLFRACSPDKLSVSCFFNRRGGISINPVRGYGIRNSSRNSEKFIRQ